MKSFQTLRGFVTGDEPDDLEPEFRYSASLRIHSQDGLSFEEIEANLLLEATTRRRRGERLKPNSQPLKYDLWIFEAPVGADRELHEHIDALWKVLRPSREYLVSLMGRAVVDVYLGYSSNIDHAGLTIPSQSLELFNELGIDFKLSIVVLPD